MVAVLLPLYFNPYAHLPIEAVKVLLFQGITLGMLIVAILSYIQALISGDYPQTNKGNIRIIFTKSIGDNPLLLPSLVFTFVYLIATYFSIDPVASFWGLSTKQGTLTVLSIIVFFTLLVTGIRSKEQADRLITSLILGSIPVAIYGWVQFLGFDPLDWVTGSISIVHSTLGYSLTLGAYLAMIIPITLSRMIGQWGDKGNRIWAYALIIILQVSCLFSTLARGAWLGLLVGCLLFLLLLAYRWQRRALIRLSTVVLIAGGLIFLLLNTGWRTPSLNILNWPSDISIVQARTISNNERLAVWRYTLPMIMERPLIGYGPETFSAAFWSYYPYESFQELEYLNPWDAHNIILNYLTAIGILGFFVFLWILVRFYRLTLLSLQLSDDRRKQIIVAAVISSVTAFLVQAQFNPIAFVPLVLFWFLLALGIVVARDHQEEDSASISIGAE
jgi:putative inorganic carbon (HCO3(-)) transporter